MDLDDEERMAQFIDKQIERAEAEQPMDEVSVEGGEGRGREGGLCGGREGRRQRAVWRGWGGEVREGCGGGGKAMWRRGEGKGSGRRLCRGKGRNMGGGCVRRGGERNGCN